MGDELKKQKKMKEYDWLMKQTKPIVTSVSSTTTVVKSISLLVITAVIAQLCI